MVRVQARQRTEEIGPLGAVAVAHRQHGEVVEGLGIDRARDGVTEPRERLKLVAALDERQRAFVFSAPHPTRRVLGFQYAW